MIHLKEMTVQQLAIHWWELQPHPFTEPYPADEFLGWLAEQLQLGVHMVAGSDYSENIFAELVGWS